MSRFSPGPPRPAAARFKLNPDGGPKLIDLTGALEDQPNARLRAPSAEASPPAASAIQVIAHPAAIAVTMLLAPLSRVAAIRRAIVHVFEPASERGQRGLDEVAAADRRRAVVPETEDRSVRRAGRPSIFWRVTARRRWSRWSRSSSVSSGIWHRCWRLIPSIPMPSLRLIQAPVFHGHSFSVWVEFEENPGAESDCASAG